MKRLLTLLSALAVLPAYAADYAQPAAAQPGAAPPAVSQPATLPAAQAHPQPKSTGTVARAQFTSAIQDREPVDKITNLSNDNTSIFFFSEIKDASNQRVTHRWEHDGKVRWEMSFDIGGNRWRVFSNLTLDPSLTGEWKVSVVDETGSALGASTFTYEMAKPAASGETTPAAVQPASPTVTPPKP
jgi:hypothetical protein